MPGWDAGCFYEEQSLFYSKETMISVKSGSENENFSNGCGNRKKINFENERQWIYESHSYIVQ